MARLRRRNRLRHHHFAFAMWSCCRRGVANLDADLSPASWHSRGCRSRHAESEPAPPGEGRDKLRRVLKRARAAGVAPSLILSSPYKRALETAEVAADILGYAGRI